MQHGRMCTALALALAIGLVADAPARGVAYAASAKSPGAEAKPAKRVPGLRQFTGVVTAVDKTSITVEKAGKTPKTMVFTRHAEISTRGELAREAKVTVFYREEDGKPVAHRVVVKGGSPTDNP